jgi:hypothetical protein
VDGGVEFTVSGAGEPVAFTIAGPQRHRGGPCSE